MVSLRSGKKISRQEGHSSRGREDHNKMNQSRESVTNDGSPRHTRASSGEGDSSLRFPFFDQTACEFMTPPPTNGRQGTRKAASVNDDDSRDAIHFELPIDISPIAQSRESDAGGHLMCMLSEDLIGGTPADILLEAASRSNSDAPDEQLPTYTAVKSGVDDDFESDLISSIINEEKSNSTAHVSSARPSLAANELISSADESSDLDDAPFSPGAPLTTFSNIRAALEKLESDLSLHEPAIGNAFSAVEEQNVAMEAASEPLDSASPENGPNTPKEDSDDIVTEVQEPSVSVNETSAPLNPASPNRASNSSNEEYNDTIGNDFSPVKEQNVATEAASEPLDSASPENGPNTPKEESDDIVTVVQEPSLSVEEKSDPLDPVSPKRASYTSNEEYNDAVPELYHLDRDLSSARKRIDESSNEFIERIRSAQRKRKVAMTRSRDSLAAKEHEQKISIAESKLKAENTRAQEAENTSPIKTQRKESESVVSNKHFKARPLPATTGEKGMGGLVGVPKVESKPTTTPFSPLLGSRRRESIKIKALEKPKPPSVKKDAEIRKSSGPKTEDVNNRRSCLPVTLPSNAPPAFRARPVPASTGLQGHGGQVGVPKVQKRPVTVPSSPCLGPRRRATSAGRLRPPKSGSSEPHSENVNQTNLASILRVRTSTESIKRNKLSLSSRPSFSKTASPASASSPLMGLRLLETTPLSLKHAGTENRENTTPRNAQISAYMPHSTVRAKKRAEFDARNDAMTQRKTEEERRQRQIEIRKMHKELRKLRQELR